LKKDIEEKIAKKLYTACGTIYYFAPELIQNKGYDGRTIDIWALGVMLYFMVSGQFPFYDEKATVILKLIIKGKYEMPTTTKISKSCQSLIEGIL
jgi:serine/threonine protein kinase